MTRPRCSFCAPGMFVLERRPRGLGKRAGRLARKGAVVRCSGFKHLRFATPARAPLHDSYGSALGRSLGPSRLTKQRARIALGASRRLERVVERQGAHEGERGQSDE